MAFKKIHTLKILVRNFDPECLWFDHGIPKIVSLGFGHRMDANYLSKPRNLNFLSILNLITKFYKKILYF
jgi:hypothetical protein